MTETITASVMENPTRQCVCGGWTRFSVCQYCGTPDPSVAAETAMPIGSAPDAAPEYATPGAVPTHEFEGSPVGDEAPSAVETPEQEVVAEAAPFTPAHTDPALFTPDYSAATEFGATEFGADVVEAEPFITEAEAFPTGTPAAVETSLGYDIPGYDDLDVPAYEISTDDVDDATPFETATFETAAFETPTFDLPEFDGSADVPHLAIPGYDEPAAESALFDAPAFDLPTHDDAFETGSFEAPAFDSAVFEAPAEVPHYEIPGYETTEAAFADTAFTEVPFEAPAFEAPAFDSADYNVAPYEVVADEPVAIETLGYDVPGYDTPVDDETVGTGPAAGLGYDETLGYDVPAFTAPVVEAPGVEAPAIEDFTLEAPAAEDVETIEAPETELPPMTFASAEDLEDEFGGHDGLPDFGSLPLDALLPDHEPVELAPADVEPFEDLALYEDLPPYEDAVFEATPIVAATPSFDEGFPPVEAAYVAVPDQLEDTQIWEPDWALDLASGDGLAPTADEVPSAPHAELEIVPAADVVTEVAAPFETDDDIVAVPELTTLAELPEEETSWTWASEAPAAIEAIPAELEWPAEPVGSDLFTPAPTEAEFVWPADDSATPVTDDPAATIESLPVQDVAPSLEIGPDGTAVASAIYEPVPDAAWGDMPSGSGWESSSFATESWTTDSWQTGTPDDAGWTSEAATESSADGDWFTPTTAAPIEADWSTPSAVTGSAWISAETAVPDAAHVETPAFETPAFESPAFEIDEPNSGAVALAESGELASGTDASATGEDAKQSHRTRNGLIAVALVGIVGVGGYALLGGGSPAAAPAGTSSTPTVTHTAVAPPAVDLNRSPAWLHLIGAAQTQPVSAIPAIEVANRTMPGVLSSTGISATTQAGTHFRATALHFTSPAAAAAFAASTPPAPWKETVSSATQRTAVSTVGVIVTTVKGSDAIAVGADNPTVAIQAQAWATILSS